MKSSGRDLPPRLPSSLLRRIPKPGERQDRAISDKYENPMDALQEVSKEYLNREI